jgi:hypothetical protein
MKRDSNSANKTRPAQRRMREFILYAIGVLCFLALLSLIVKERVGSPDGN